MKFLEFHSLLYLWDLMALVPRWLHQRSSREVSSDGSQAPQGFLRLSFLTSLLLALKFVLCSDASALEYSSVLGLSDLVAGMRKPAQKDAQSY